LNASSAAEIVSRPEPRVGEHTEEILHEVGLTNAEIATLVDAEVVVQRK